jgi:hypothetical protein
MTMAVAGRMSCKVVVADTRSHLRITGAALPERDEASRGKGGFVNEGGGSTVGRAGRLSDHT